eukprot:764905-Hanusia_phi.AAC.2
MLASLLKIGLTLTVFKVQHSDLSLKAAKLSTLDTGLSRLRRLSSSPMHTRRASYTLARESHLTLLCQQPL